MFKFKLFEHPPKDHNGRIQVTSHSRPLTCTDLAASTLRTVRTMAERIGRQDSMPGALLHAGTATNIKD